MSHAQRQKRLNLHVARLQACTLCPRMAKPVVSGGAVMSRIVLVGQAPGDKEPKFGRPFAWTAGRTLFKWFHRWGGMTEEEFRGAIYMAAVCRCFPGKKATGGDRVPSEDEISNCSNWLEAELEILEPELIIPVGKLAIAQFLPATRLDEMIGRVFEIEKFGRTFEVIPLPHPSGASPWHRMEPGLTLLEKAIKQIVAHSAFRGLKT